MNSRYRTTGRVEFYEVSQGVLNVTLTVSGLSNGNHSYHGAVEHVSWPFGLSQWAFVRSGH